VIGFPKDACLVQATDNLVKVQSSCSSTCSLRACDGIGEGSVLAPSDTCKKSNKAKYQLLH